MYVILTGSALNVNLLVLNRNGGGSGHTSGHRRTRHITANTMSAHNTHYDVTPLHYNSCTYLQLSKYHQTQYNRRRGKKTANKPQLAFTILHRCGARRQLVRRPRRCGCRTTRTAPAPAGSPHHLLSRTANQPSFSNEAAGPSHQRRPLRASNLHPSFRSRIRFECRRTQTLV